MSALAVYLERAGISTVVIGLIRLHMETTQPPRALWVPFELGRPLGGPGEPAFQKKVLLSALSLLERNDGPVILEDFADEDPGAVADASWVAPDLSDATSVDDEISALKSRYEQSVARYGRSMVGLSGMSINDAGRFLAGFDTNAPVPNPGDDMSDLLRARFCADDLRVYFSEAAASDGDPTSQQINDWFWNNTRVAQELIRIRAASLGHENKTRALVGGKLLVPSMYAPV